MNALVLGVAPPLGMVTIPAQDSPSSSLRHTTLVKAAKKTLLLNGLIAMVLPRVAPEMLSLLFHARLVTAPAGMLHVAPPFEVLITARSWLLAAQPTRPMK